MKYTFCFLLLMLSISLSAQRCPCLAKFNQIKRSVETEYSLFNEKTNHFGVDEYHQMTEEIKTDILDLDAYKGCFQTIKAWLLYFKDEKLKLQILDDKINFEVKT